MLYDAKNLFSNNQTIVGAGASVVSENVIHHGGGDFGNGEPLYISLATTTPFVGVTAFAVALETSDVEDFATLETLYTHDVPILAVTDPGSNVIANLPPIPAKTRPYIRLKYAVTGTATAGTIYCGITGHPDTGNTVRPALA